MFLIINPTTILEIYFNHQHTVNICTVVFIFLFNLFQCELIMEKHEPHITEVFKEEKPHEDAVIELCETRTKLCSGLKKKLAKDEL